MDGPSAADALIVDIIAARISVGMIPINRFNVHLQIV